MATTAFKKTFTQVSDMSARTLSGTPVNVRTTVLTNAAGDAMPKDADETSCTVADPGLLMGTPKSNNSVCTPPTVARGATLTLPPIALHQKCRCLATPLSQIVSSGPASQLVTVSCRQIPVNARNLCCDGHK